MKMSQTKNKNKNMKMTWKSQKEKLPADHGQQPSMLQKSEDSLKRQCELMDQLSLVSFRREISKAYTENANVVGTKAEPVQQRI